MHAFKKIGLVLAGLLFGPFLVLSIVAFTFSRTVGSQDYTKQVLHEAQVYHGISRAIIDKAEGESGSQPLVRKALERSLGDAQVEKISEPIIDSSYAWLRGDRRQPDFNFSLASVQKNFEASLRAQLTARAKKLPPCSYANLPATTDIYTISCIPPGTNVSQVINNAVQRVSNSADLFTDQAVEDKKLDQTEIQDLGINAIPEKPAETIPKVYQLLMNGLPWFIVLTVLAGSGLVFLSSRKLTGLRKIGIIGVVDGVVLIILSGILNFALSTLTPTASVSATEAPVNALEEATKIIIGDVSHILRIIGLVLVIAGIAAIVTTTAKLREATAKAK